MTRRLWSHLRTGFKTGWTKLPRALRNVAAKVELQIASIPRIHYDEAIHGPRLVRGAVVISFDFEMAWGWQHRTRGTIDFEAKGLWERAQIPVLLKALERYSIPATWFTVGHLFLDRCTRGTDGRAHADMPRLGKGRFDWYRFDSGDWFQNDPCSDVYRDPAWYAPDLLEMILKSPVGHEIGSHTFSHAYLGVKCPPTVAAAELRASIGAMAKFGVKPESLSFPREYEGNFEAILQAGIRIIRASTARSAILSLPVLRGDGLWVVHSSTPIDRGARWSVQERLARLRGFADAAARSKLAFHLFLHPSLSTEEGTEIFIPFMAYCAEQRERGLLDIVTVRDLVGLMRRPAPP